jgi:hypothetical protein
MKVSIKATVLYTFSLVHFWSFDGLKIVPMTLVIYNKLENLTFISSPLHMIASEVT